MRHLSKISDDEVSLYILTKGKGKLGFMSAECNILEDFLDSDRITLLIRDFDTNESKPWDWCLDTDTFCLEREREIFF